MDEEADFGGEDDPALNDATVADPNDEGGVDEEPEDEPKSAVAEPEDEDEGEAPRSAAKRAR